ncbi:hypothetical protein UVI_02056470 [Ustilaginoidea virens]|uniref:SH3 domain-containing protein n=1 Tax=Ustilaginoidea virens TaxID=1159556 RepID=A0A1B5L664_USTVR|nr:hypothetical protein UVI_02056470 [Ustilaginoidea virens]
MTVPFRVKALYEYSSPHDDDLNFNVGQIITVTEEEDQDWYGGQYLDDDGIKKEGIFPRNFVEKLEPTAPPRPTRTRPKREPDVARPAETVAPAPPPPAPTAEKPASVENVENVEISEPKPERPVERDIAIAEPEPPVTTVSAVPVASKPAQPALAKPPPKVVSPPVAPAAAAEPSGPNPRAGPPSASEKPLSNSFKDRIAAFNKPAAPPVAPFKPTGLGGGAGPSAFVKKTFVAPPPSRNAYVLSPREKPATSVYHREEDPEIKEREAEAQSQAERAGLVPADQSHEGGENDQPKPTSLKERIALLQRQQVEQARRHADAAAKKERPKKPQKKKPDTAAQGDEGVAETGEGALLSPSLERAETGETEAGTSTDEANVRSLSLPRRRASKGLAVDESHDGNEADMSGAGDTTEGQDDLTEREDSEEPSRNVRRRPTSHTTAATVPHHEAEAKTAATQPVGQQDEEEGEDEEDDVDPEVRRREELRARMAKMSGGMGFHGMFGAPIPPMAKPPSKKKTPKAVESAMEEEQDTEKNTLSRAGAPPIPTAMALPGMGNALAPSRGRHDEQEGGEDDVGEDTPGPSRTAPHSLPARASGHRDDADVEEEEQEEQEEEERDGEAMQAPIPDTASRAPPPPPPLPAEIKAPTDGSESDDELSGGGRDNVPGQVGVHAKRSPPMPPQPASGLPTRPPPLSPRPDDLPAQSSAAAAASKRTSRPPPPIPGSAPALPPATSRPPPPPPPPAGDLRRQSTLDAAVATPSRPPQAGEEEDEEVTEYEGDYDTDIASSAPHKDALKAHARESSVEDNMLQSPVRETPPSIPPPVPSAAAPRAVPPPIPSQPPTLGDKRQSIDVPRAAPPPPPTPAKDAPAGAARDTDEYDPYNYASPLPPPAAPPAGSTYSHRTPKIDEDKDYFPGPAAAVPGSSVPERRPPPAATPGRAAGNRPSLDLPRTSTSNRRSMDMHRPSVESDFIANDVDLAVQNGWWKQANQVPPIFQGRKDIHYESEETTTTNQGAKTVTRRDVFVLFQDYSQTIVTVRYDPYNPSDAELDQRHEAPPRALRQDQMEEFHERYGRQISDAATSKKDTVVGDGTPQGFVLEMLRPLSGALPPVGTRSYGALVYANMANASIQQQDVIRAGDIISFRNAKFQGKHGPMHAKYSAEVGKPDHVAVVAEWDGTKKKVRAWEQGRENKKVKMESYKLDDLRSGEVKIWRVVPRSWVAWNMQPWDGDEDEDEDDVDVDVDVDVDDDDDDDNAAAAAAVVCWPAEWAGCELAV